MKMFDFETYSVKLRLIQSIIYGAVVSVFSYIIYSIFDMADYGLDYYIYFALGMTLFWFFFCPYAIKLKKE